MTSDEESYYTSAEVRVDFYDDICGEDIEYLRGLVRDVSCRLVCLDRVTLPMECVLSLVM